MKWTNNIFDSYEVKYRAPLQSDHKGISPIISFVALKVVMNRTFLTILSYHSVYDLDFFCICIYLFFRVI